MKALTGDERNPKSWDENMWKCLDEAWNIEILSSDESFYQWRGLPTIPLSRVTSPSPVAVAFSPTVVRAFPAPPVLPEETLIASLEVFVKQENVNSP